MKEYALLLISTVLVNNFVLVQFLGLCPFMGVSRNSSASVGMGAATCFVLTVASAFSYVFDHYVLVPLELTYLRTLSFILLIACTVQFTEMVVHSLRIRSRSGFHVCNDSVFHHEGENRGGRRSGTIQGCGSRNAGCRSHVHGFYGIFRINLE